MHVTTHDGIALPVPDGLAKLGFEWPLEDGAFAGQHAPEVEAAVTFAPELADDSGIAPQVAAGALVPSDATVDGLVADAQHAALSQRADDLLGTPPAADELSDGGHVGGTEVSAASAAAASGNGVAMGLLGPVLQVMVGAVATQPARDGAGVPGERAGDVRLRITGHGKAGDGVSFFLGELVIRRHGCNPFPGRMRKHLVSPLPTSFQRALHLLCESAMPNPAFERTRRSIPRRQAASNHCKGILASMSVSVQMRNMQMRNPTIISAAFVALVISSVSIAQEQSTAKPPPPLLREIVQGMPKGERQEVRVLTATLKPGEKTPFHTHRFPVTVYVVEGTFTLEMEGRATVTAKAGQAIVEPPQVKMTGYNRSSTEPMRVVIFYVSDPDTPFLDPAHH